MLLEEVKPHEQVHLFDEFYLQLAPDRSDEGEVWYNLETFGDIEPVGFAYTELYASFDQGDRYNWHLEWGVYAQSQGVSQAEGSNLKLFREWCIKTLREMMEEEHGTR